MFNIYADPVPKASTVCTYEVCEAEPESNQDSMKWKSTEEPTQDMDVAPPGGLCSFLVCSVWMIVSIVVLREIYTSMAYWSCLPLGSVTCPTLAQDTKAWDLWSIPLAMALSAWLKRYMASIQTRTLRFWLRVLIAGYMCPVFLLGACSYCLSAESRHRLAETLVTAPFKYVYDLRTLRFFFTCIWPYWSTVTSF